MTFQEYCESKKIDAAAFQKGNPEHYSELESIFNEVSPASFTQQKKFIINTIRRAYQLKVEAVIKEKPVAKKPAIKIPGVKPKAVKPAIPGAKPVIKPKVGGTAKPVIKKSASSEEKPKTAALKPKIPGAKPVVKKDKEDKPKPAVLKPKIPGAKKPAVLKPKIPKK